MNLVSGNPACAQWTRSYDDAGVVGLRNYLREHNGIKGLELVSSDEPLRAAELFHRDGFVAIRDALSPELLMRMR